MQVFGDLGKVAVDILDHLDRKDPAFKHVMLTDTEKSNIYHFIMNGYVPMRDDEVMKTLDLAVDGLHRVGDAVIYKVPIERWMEIQEYYRQQDYDIRVGIRENAPRIAGGGNPEMAEAFHGKPEGEPQTITLPKTVRGPGRPPKEV
jgi:hypothetical protein